MHLDVVNLIVRCILSFLFEFTLNLRFLTIVALILMIGALILMMVDDLVIGIHLDRFKFKKIGKRGHH